MKLPSYAEMLKDAELALGTPTNSLLSCDPITLDGVDYYEKLSSASGAISLPSYFKPTYLLSKNMSCFDKLHFRDYNYITYDDGRVERVPIDSTNVKIMQMYN